MTKSNDTWIEVLWLRPHQRFGYFPGELGKVQKKDIKELLGRRISDEIEVKPYVRVVSSEDVTAILESRKPAPPSEEPLIYVRFLKCHPQYAYSLGQLGRIFLSAAQLLAEEGYVEPLTEEEYQSAIASKKPQKPSPSDFVKVTFLKYHGDFSYSVGDTGTVAKGKFPKLLEGGYVELFQEVSDNVSAWDRFTKKVKK
jgi:hypothetical protein